jgi:hypothetical protein
MIVFRRFFISPLGPVLCLIFLSIWIVVDETGGPARIIVGRPDNASRNAALLAIVFSPIFYICCFLLNMIDSFSDRFGAPVCWWLSGGTTAVLSILPFQIFYAPGIDSSPGHAIVTSILIALLSVWPMCLLRRLSFGFGSPGKAAGSAHRVPSERAFPAVRRPGPESKVEDGAPDRSISSFGKSNSSVSGAVAETMPKQSSR